MAHPHCSAGQPQEGATWPPGVAVDSTPVSWTVSRGTPRPGDHCSQLVHAVTVFGVQTPGASWGWQCPVFLIWVLVARCIQFVKIPSATHLKYVHSSVCMWHINKKFLRRGAWVA